MTRKEVKIPVKVKEEVALSQLETGTSNNTPSTDYLETLRNDCYEESTEEEIEDVITALGMVDPKQCLNDIEICHTINNLVFLIPDYFPNQFDRFFSQLESLVGRLSSLANNKKLNEVEELAYHYIRANLDIAIFKNENNQLK
jgi:hypothetical protein